MDGVVSARKLMVSHDGHCVFDAFNRGFCWSANDSGELTTAVGHEVGHLPRAAVEIPLPADVVTLMPSLKAIARGPVLTWGYPSTLGRVPPQSPQHAPGKVSGLEDPIEVLGGKVSYCANLRSGRVECWGQELLPFADAYEPFVAFEHGPYKKITVSELLCALDFEGRVECFDARDRNAERSGVRDIAAGVSSLCLLTEQGEILCKGSNTEAQLGNGIVGGPASSELNALTRHRD